MSPAPSPSPSPAPAPIATRWTRARARVHARVISLIRLTGLGVSLSALASAVGACRTAVVAVPNDPKTQTVVTVEQRPATNPSDKHLIVRDRP